jgi:hypothetical protein
MKTKEIKPCSCGEKEFLQVLPKFNKKQVHCVNCGNNSFAMATEEKAIEAWNKINRFEKVPEKSEYANA